MTASKAKSKSASSRQRRETLTVEEQAELEQALGDGFKLRPQDADVRTVEIADVVDEPFAEARIISGWLDAFDPLGSEIVAALETAQTLEEKQQAVKTKLVGRPEWRSHNPFQFDQTALKDYFEHRVMSCQPSIGGSVEDPLTADQIAQLEPFTKAWFEHLAVYELRKFERMWEAARGDARKQANRSSPAGFLFDWQLIQLLETSAKVARLIENYRWRFTHGTDTLRGKKTGRAAEQGGSTRRGKLAADTEEVLRFMREQIAAGRSVRNAAARAAHKGIGKSMLANEKAWYRHKKTDTER